MHPVLFSIGSFRVPTYGVLYLIAFLSGTAIAAYLGRSRTVPFLKLFEIMFQATIAGEIGARLTFVIVEWDRFVSGAIGVRQFLLAGRVVLGGVVAGVAYSVWAIRRYDLDVGRFLDALMTGVAFGMGVGRLACLAAGCCFGKPTDAWWGITFTDPLARALNGTPLHTPLVPTQIIQSISAFALFALLFHMHRWKKFDGQVAATFFLVAGLLRITNEFLRGDPRGAVLGLSTSQWIGGAIAIAAATWLVRRTRTWRRETAGA